MPIPNASLSMPPRSPTSDRPPETYNDLDAQSSDDESATVLLRKKVPEGRPRFLGKSSQFKFVQQALQFCHQTTGEIKLRPRPRPEFLPTQTVCRPLDFRMVMLIVSSLRPVAHFSDGAAASPPADNFSTTRSPGHTHRPVLHPLQPLHASSPSSNL